MANAFSFKSSGISAAVSSDITLQKDYLSNYLPGNDLAILSLVMLDEYVPPSSIEIANDINSKFVVYLTLTFISRDSMSCFIFPSIIRCK